MAQGWNAGTFYLPGQQATYNSVVYTATSLQPNSNHQPDINPSWWLTSTNYTAIVSLNQEQWNNGTYYLPNSEVQWLGTTYVATTLQPNRGNPPDTNPSWWTASASPGVTQLIAGTNISLSPTSGVGAVTINSTGSGGVASITAGTGITVGGTTKYPIISNAGVTQLVAGTNVTLSPTSGLGAVTVNTTPTWIGTATSDLNMNGHNIYASGTQLLSIGTNTSPYPNNIAFSNYGGTLGDIKINSYNITVGNDEGGTVVLRSGSSGYVILEAGNIRSQGTLDMYTNNITNINNLYSAGNFNIYAPTGLGVGFNNTTYFNNFSINDVGTLGFYGGVGVINSATSLAINSATTTYNGTLNMSNHAINGVGDINAYANVAIYATTGHYLGFYIGTSLIQIDNSNNINPKAPLVNINNTGGGSLVFDTNVDLNCANGRFLTLGNSGGGSYFQIQSGGSQILVVPTGQSIGLSATTINLVGNTAQQGTLDMCNHDINNVGTYLRFNTGAYLDSYTPGGFANAFLEIQGTGGDSQLRINNGSAQINLIANNDLYITPSSGHSILMNGNTNMNGNYINNIGNLYGVNDLTLTASGHNVNVYANTMNLVTANLDMYGNSIVNVVDIGSYTNMNIHATYATNASITISANSNINLIAPTTSITGNLNMNGNNINNAVTITSASVNTLTLQNNSGSAYFQIFDAGNIYAVGNGGLTNQGMSNGLIFNSAQNITNKVFGATSAHTFGVYDGSATLKRTVTIDSNGISNTLNNTSVLQPVIQYGIATGSGVSGTVSVTIPVAYSGRATYVVQVTMRDAPTAQLYATPITPSSFTIGWSSAGSGSQNIMWTTFGS